MNFASSLATRCALNCCILLVSVCICCLFVNVWWDQTYFIQYSCHLCFGFTFGGRNYWPADNICCAFLIYILLCKAVKIFFYFRRSFVFWRNCFSLTFKYWGIFSTPVDFLHLHLLQSREIPQGFWKISIQSHDYWNFSWYFR